MKKEAQISPLRGALATALVACGQFCPFNCAKYLSNGRRGRKTGSEDVSGATSQSIHLSIDSLHDVVVVEFMKDCAQFLRLLWGLIISPLFYPFILI